MSAVEQANVRNEVAVNVINIDGSRGNERHSIEILGRYSCVCRLIYRFEMSQ